MSLMMYPFFILILWCGFAAAFYWLLDVARKFGECVFVCYLFMTYRMKSDGLS